MELASANARLSGALVNPELPHVIDEKGRTMGRWTEWIFDPPCPLASLFEVVLPFLVQRSCFEEITCRSAETHGWQGFSITRHF
jgi:hypothetical protein